MRTQSIPSGRAPRMLIGVASAALVAGTLAVAAPADASTPFDPYSIPIPAMCQHKASRLHHGEVDFGNGRGGASLVDLAKDSEPRITKPLVAKQRGHSNHGAAAAVPIWCTAGGVSWPETIAVYTRSGRLLASLDLGPLVRTEHAAVTSISLRGDIVKARWDAYEGAGFDVRHQLATFTLAHGRLTVSHYVQ